MATSTIQVLDPSMPPRPGEFTLAPRLGSLDGKVIGILDNSKPNADILLTRVAELIAQRTKPAEIIVKSKLRASSAAPPEILEELATRCDAVVTALGD